MKVFLAPPSPSSFAGGRGGVGGKRRRSLSLLNEQCLLSRGFVAALRAITLRGGRRWPLPVIMYEDYERALESNDDEARRCLFCIHEKLLLKLTRWYECSGPRHAGAVAACSLRPN